MIEQLLENLMNDWPLLGVLMAMLIGLYRLFGRIIDIAVLHYQKQTDALEAIADEIRRKDEDRGG